MNNTSKSKIPFYLVTGFLGSGKTTFLQNLLKEHNPDKKILLVQNEFSASDVDSTLIRDSGWKTSILEMNKGSVFCVCLFSDFKTALMSQIEETKPDLILLEATGMADPIAVAQLLDDKWLHEHIYLSHIWSIVDAPRFPKIFNGIQAVRHQIQVADTVIINKVDLSTSTEVDSIVKTVQGLNPFAEIQICTHCKVETKTKFQALFRPLPIVIQKGIKGELTKCGSDYNSQLFKSTSPINEAKLDAFFETLDENTYRIKGYVKLDTGNTILVQYVPGQLEKIQIKGERSTTELIAISSHEIDFNRINS